MYHRYYYRPYPYYRRYYIIDPYYYRRYYSPYNIIDSQIANIDQSIINHGDMNDVYQDIDVYQSMASVSQDVGICTTMICASQSPIELPAIPPS